MLADDEIEAASGWVDPAYREHELAQAIRAIADEARGRRAIMRGLGIPQNVSAGDAVQSSIRSALNVELHQYGLRVVRIPNWRGDNH